METPRRGFLSGDFDPLTLKEGLFRVGTGEARFLPEHGYPLLEMLRNAKYGFDKNRHLIPAGKVHVFEDRLLDRMQNAALIEMQFQAELRLLNCLLLENSISKEVFERHLSAIQSNYQRLASEAAYATANWLAAIQNAIAPRRRGRPNKRLLPDDADIRDWQIVLVANAHVAPPFNSKSPLQQCLEAIPASVKKACEVGILAANNHPDVLAAGKMYEAHIKRISAKALKWLG
ncbi:hypothetical protein MCEMSEM23_00975 [Rhabdaerophilaceae bacterium]